MGANAVEKMENKKRILEEDAMWLMWNEKCSEIYDNIYYQSNPLVKHFNLSGHWLLEKPFKQDTHFSKVLEVGAGTGVHLDYVRHTYDEYIATDISEQMLDLLTERHKDKKNVTSRVVDATNLDYEDNTFDRLISVYNLEHIINPHLALKEWERVVKPGGTISISIPTEGGIAWNFGRYISTRRSFAKHGLDLDYIIAREHVNACYRLVAFIKHYFPNRKATWYPLGVPLTHANLIYAVNVEV